MDSTILVTVRGTIHQIDDGQNCFQCRPRRTTTVSVVPTYLDLQFGAGRIELLDINIFGTGGVVRQRSFWQITFGESVDESAGNSVYPQAVSK